MALKELDFHLTNRCNMRCRHCVFTSGERIINEMGFDEIASCIFEFAKITRSKGIINLFGGEVLLRNDIFKIIKLAKQSGLNVGLTTNIQVSHKKLLQLIRLKLSRITIDLNGATPFTHDWLKNAPGHFKKTVNQIKLFISSGIYTTINCVLYKRNIQEITDVLELGKKLGINAAAFYFFTPIGRGAKISNMIIGPDEWILIKNKIINWIKKNKPRFDIVWERAYEEFSHKKAPSLYRCGTRHTETIFIRCDGEVYSCALLESTPYGLGNIKKDNLKNILKRRSKFGFNKTKVCPALAFWINKDINGSDPRPSTSLIHPACPYDYQIFTQGEFIKSIYI